MEVLEFIVETGGERLDVLLAGRVERLSRSQLQALIKAGGVMVNGSVEKPSLKLRGGETVRVELPAPLPDARVLPEALPLTVLYEDAALAVIDKPAGMVVHPGDGGETGTLVNALLARYPEVAQMTSDARRRGIVHRLDKDTSGVMVVARTETAQRALMQQFGARRVQKMYLALLEKMPPTQTGRIEVPIGRDPAQRKRMAVLRAGRPAISVYRVLEGPFADGQTFVEVEILTGRTHQIRVHMAYIGCPLVGDRVYGYRKQRLALSRQFLHAAKLAFTHPVTGERLTFESPLPDDLTGVLAALRG